jgi:ParB family chromosome partitioning protein
MRHNVHFVDELMTKFEEENIGTMIPVQKICSNPFQPRANLGELDDLVASVREKGVLEPLLVKEDEGAFVLIAGERRLRAAQKAGLQQVPCVVMDVGEEEMLEIALVENLQRKDLDPFEEADALRRLSDEFEYSHAEIAERLGRSRTTVTEILRLVAIPEEVRALARRAGVTSKSALLQLAREGDPNKMVDCLDRISAGEVEPREEAVRRRQAEAGRRPGRPKNFTFRFAPKGAEFSLNLRFRRTRVTREELIETLRAVLDQLLEEEG